MDSEKYNFLSSITKLIQDGKLEKTFAKLNQFDLSFNLDIETKNEITLLQSQYSQFKKDYSLGLVSDSSLKNRIVFSLIEIISKLKILSASENEFEKSFIFDDSNSKTGQPSYHFSYAPAQDSNFTGRSELILKFISNWESINYPLVGIVGWGGYGKTTLAIEFFWELKSKNWCHKTPKHVIWWSFQENDNFSSFVQYFLESINSDDTIFSKSLQFKCDYIINYLSKEKVILYLDAIEGIFQTSSSFEKESKLVNGFFFRIAESKEKQSLCIYTSRLSLIDRLNLSIDIIYEVNLEKEKLNRRELINLCNNLEQKNKIEQCTRLYNLVNYNLLFFSLLLKLTRVHFDNDIDKLVSYFENNISSRFNFDSKISNILSWYNAFLNDFELELLKIASLFLKPVSFSILQKVSYKFFQEKLTYSPSNNYFSSIDKLLVLRLFLFDNSKQLLTIHNLIKEYYKNLISEKDKKTIYSLIFDEFKLLSNESNADAINYLYDSVFYGCYSERHEESLLIFKERINKNYVFLGRLEGGISILNELVKNFFVNLDIEKMPIVSKSSDKTYLQFVAGWVLRNSGDIEKGRKLLLKAAQSDKTENRKRYTRKLISTLYRQGRLKECLEWCEKLDIQADSIDAKKNILWYGNILTHLGEYSKATNIFNQISLDELSESSISPTANLYATYLVRISKFDEGKELTQKLIQTNTSTKHIGVTGCSKRILGSILRMEGKFEEAEKKLHEAIEDCKKSENNYFVCEVLIEYAKLKITQYFFKNHEVSNLISTAKSTIYEAINIDNVEEFKLLVSYLNFLEYIVANINKQKNQELFLQKALKISSDCSFSWIKEDLEKYLISNRKKI